MINLVRLRVACTLLLTFVMGISLVQGQDDPRGPHRLLPSGNASSIQQQMELLQKLQLLALRSKESGIDPFDGIDADDVEKLKNWLEKTNPDVPEGLAEYLKNLDPRMLQQGLNSQDQPPLPQSDRLKKLMEQLSQQSGQNTGQSDEPGGSPQTKNPQDDENKSGFSFRSKRDRSRFPPSDSPARNPNQNPAAENNNDSSSRKRMEEEASGATNLSEDPTTDPLNDPRIPPHLRKILQQYRRDSQKKQDEPERTGNNSDSNGGSRIPGGTPQISPRDLSPDLEKLADRLRGNGSEKRGSGSSGSGGSDFFEPGNMPNIDPQQQREMLNQLLKLMAEADPQPNGSASSNNKQSAQDNAPTAGEPDASAEPTDASPLSMKDLKDSWKSILEQARTNTGKQEADAKNGDAKNGAVEEDSNNLTPAASESKENSALSRISKAVTESMKQSAEEGKQRRRERSQTSATQPDRNLNVPEMSNPRSQDSNKRGGMFSQLQDVAKSANQAIREFSTPPEEDGSPQAAAVPTTDGVSSSSGTLLLLVAAVACTLIALLWVFRKRIGSLIGEESSVTSFATPPAKLTTREEIVRAFHVIVSRSPGVAADWWPHSKAGRALAESSPETREAVQTLVEVYEQARYLPEDAMLSEDEYRRAKEAYERCMAS